MPVGFKAPIKCGNCGEVTVFEVAAPASGSKSFKFVCPHCGRDVMGPKGIEVVDLSKYDESRLRHVSL